MRHALAVMAVLAIGALAGCERPTNTSTTVKETVVQREAPPAGSTTTIVQPVPVPVESAKKPETTETQRSSTTTRVDTPEGTATRTDTETKKTTTK